MLLKSVEPVYPDAERAKGETASVGLVLSIDVEGHVSDVSVVRSAGPAFDAAATEAAKQLAFTPATRAGKATAARIPFSFEFVLAPATNSVSAGAASDAARQSERPTPSASNPASAAKPAATPAPVAPLVASDDEGIDVDVTGKRPPREPTKHVIEAAELTKIPGTNGDALRAIGSMPGVARPPGLAGLIIVRGSAPNDTQVHVDGTTVPIAYHFGGLSSVVPSEMLERLDFYPGNFGPEYGRAMGGVIDVGLRSPRKDRIGGLVQIDMLDARLLAEGPISKHTRFMVAGRRSWVDTWLGPMMRSAGLGVSVAPVYYDYQAMLEHDLSRATTLRLTAFGSDDRLALTQNTPDATDPAQGGDLSLHTRFWRVQARGDTRLSANARWINTLSYGSDANRFGTGNLGLDVRIRPLEARSDVRFRISPALTAVAGLDAMFASYDVLWKFPPFDLNSQDTAGPLFGRPVTPLRGQGNLFRPAAYAMLEVAPLRGLKLLPGVRADYARDTEHVTLDPRIAARYDLRSEFPRTTLKGGVGVFHQPPEPYESSEPFGTKGVQANRAIHYSAGVEQEFTQQVELSVEGFYKDLDQLVEPVPAANATANGFLYQNVGSGRSYGTEFLLRYKPDARFFGWIAYTLSRSERTDGPGQATHVFQYDQTHILTALASVKLGRGWQLGGRFRYVTGSPYTPYAGGVMDYDAGTYSPVSGAQWSERLAAFHQLDLRVDKTWKFNAWQFTAYLDLQNAYYRKNPEGVSYNYNYSQSSTLSGLPILPVLGFKGEI